MKRIFITGITGLLGTNLANALLDLDYEVTAIIRNPDKYIGKRNGNLNLVQMDLWGDYDKYLNETDIVVHIAAETGTHLIKYADYERTRSEERRVGKECKTGIEAEHVRKKEIL